MTRAALGVAWLVLSALFLWMNSTALELIPGDEGIYLYAGKLLTAGQWPQRDYFFAHPPLRVVLAGLLYGMGAPAWAPKLLALLACPVAAGLLGWAIHRDTGFVGAVVAMGAYLFATLNFELAGAFLGPNIAAALLAGCLLAARSGRFGLAGALLSLAALQAYYALLPAPILALWAWRRGRLLPLVAGTMGFVVAFLALWAWVGSAFVEDTVLYQVRKVTRSDAAYPLGKLSRLLTTEAGLIAFGLAGFLDRRPAARWTAGAGLFCLLVPIVYRSLHGYYFMMSFPFLAAAAGAGVCAISDRVRDRSMGVRIAVAATVGVAMVVTYLPHFLFGWDYDHLRGLQARETAALTDAVYAHRTDSGLLFGDSAIVPLIAVSTDLEIPGGMVDMNSQRFLPGLTTPEEVLSVVYDGRGPGTLLLDHHGIATVQGMPDRIRKDRIEVFQFVGPAIGYTCRYLVREEDIRSIGERLGKTARSAPPMGRAPSTGGAP